MAVLGLPLLGALLAFVEVLPPLGRFIPGQLLVGAVAAVAVHAGAAPLPLVGAVFVGAFAGDALNLARAGRHARWALDGSRKAALPGGRLDHLERALREAPVRTVLARRFFTLDRALMPWAAGAWGIPALPYLALDALACILWAGVWVAAGTLFAMVTLSLAPALSVIITSGALLIVGKPLQNHRRDDL